jgi:hypothetical protein
VSKPANESGFSRRNFLHSGSAATLVTMLGAVPSAAQPAHKLTSAAPEGKNVSTDFQSDAGFPRVWMSCRESALPTASFEDLASHGVQVIETTDIQSARKHGLQVMLASDVGGQAY